MAQVKLSTRLGKNVLVRTLVASAVLTAMQRATAADDSTVGPSSQLEEIIVTAQKRSENLQNVPIAVEVLGEAQLEQMNVQGIDDYIKLLPNVTYAQSTGSPGRANIFMRGITSGLGLPNLESPLVGFYIDEVPTTTSGGQIDFHIYDVARIEALAGPQGTLYGASSEAGTLRIITNKPDTSGFSAGYNVNVNGSKHGAPGDVVEGFVNIPLTNNMAIRVVAYQEHDGGYINNVPTTITYPTTGYTVNNASLVKNDFNSIDTYGGRAALKIDLDEDWTVLASVIGQDQRTQGFFAYANSIGVDEVGFHLPENSHDSYWAPALTVTGKISNFDVTYTGSYLVHNAQQLQDYTDYSYFYDQAYQFGSKTYGPGGTAIDIGQTASQQYWYRKIAHEARFESPKDQRFRVNGGLFTEKQLRTNYYGQIVAGNLDPSLSVPGFPDIIWLARNKTADQDYAAFTTLSYDITPNLTLDAGGRRYHYSRHFQQFTGGGANPNDFQYPFGVASCIDSQPFLGAPCTDINESLAQSGGVYKGTITYKIDPDHLIYFTASDGYRPGGFNENTGGQQPYTAETLTNYEVGWKTSWLGNRLRWNGDFFYDPWNDFQFSFQGTNGNQVTANAGAALSKGIESDLSWKVDAHLSISGAMALTDAKLTKNYCGVLLASGQPETDCAAPQAPAGTQLPVTPYVKGNVIARYGFKVGNDLDAYFQESTMYTGSSWNYLLTNVGGIDPRAVIGQNPAFIQEDLAAGLSWDKSNLELFVKNATNADGQLNRFVKCNVQLCGSSVYTVNIRPMMIGLKFGQHF